MRVTVIIKGKRYPELRSAYLPLCKVDMTEKVLEKFIRTRFAKVVRAIR